ncbi:hypothetical protein CAPTEDRAFT_204570 [Capitella teleta]|uniref:WIF domain-containing protein n=1 Tax=Capitella teleta TaxID=283909 RepID=R7TWA7_CAPTE|nr:hypothetical protein CAPTEDRAFT_204570 [Capitella teleta]|eukprot:ELT98024.1 hypothetical protein CAPTEDRAFT_204570 [Capitella teleta]
MSASPCSLQTSLYEAPSFLASPSLDAGQSMASLDHPSEPIFLRRRIEGELYYVRDGNINDYALGFKMTIKTEIDRIFFNWQNLRRPSSMVMLYQLSVVSSNTKALHPPQLNIPSDGVVPTKMEDNAFKWEILFTVFSITMACTGHVIDEVDVLIQLNVTMNSASNVTVLNINRKKTCLKGNHDTAYAVYNGIKATDFKETVHPCVTRQATRYCSR